MILPPTIETERLTLRAPTAADFEPYAATMGSDRASGLGGPFEKGESYDIFCSEVADWILRGFGSLTIEDRASQSFAGAIVLQQPPRYPECEFGWVVSAEFEGQSVAHEAALAVLRYFFETRGWKTVVSYIDDGNTRSIALAERLGAVRDEAAATPGDSDDVLVYRHTPQQAMAA